MQQACLSHQPEEDISRPCSLFEHGYMQWACLSHQYDGKMASAACLSHQPKEDISRSLSLHLKFPLGDVRTWSSHTQGTTRNSDGSIHKVSFFSLLATTCFFPMTISLNHTFPPNDNTLGVSHITQQHKNKQNTQTFAFITFHSQ